MRLWDARPIATAIRARAALCLRIRAAFYFYMRAVILYGYPVTIAARHAPFSIFRFFNLVIFMKKISLSIAILVACAACNDADKECNSHSAPYCTADAKTRMVCQDNVWVAMHCLDAVCAYNSGAAMCVSPSVPTPSTCQPGQNACLSDSLLLSCLNDGSREITVCAANASCKDGACSENDTPDTPTTQAVASRTCANDSTLLTKFADGTQKSQPCAEIVGFDAQCRESASGFAGCYPPAACNDVFSNNGTCIQNSRMFCDNLTYITPRPAIQNCAAIDQECAALNDVTGCYTRCDTPNPAGVSCIPIGADAFAVSRCIAADDGKGVIQTADKLCLNDSVSVTCNGAEPVQTSCNDGETCIPTLGTCAQTCAAADLGQYFAAPNGEIMVCKAVPNGYAYLSEGRRYCDGDIYVSTTREDDASPYTLKKVNCAEVEKDGKIYNARCALYADYMPDSEMCIARYEGEPCGEIKEEGICNGNTLSYCVEKDNALQTVNCAENDGGYNKCSVFLGYASCRQTCKNQGFAACILNSTSQTYNINVCAPSDDGSSNTIIEGSVICLGNVLYSCDENGRTKTENCAANGGRCETSQCVYPSCAIDGSSLCTASDTILSCQIDTNGAVLGTTQQSVSCSPNGQCLQCKDGKIVDF